MADNIFNNKEKEKRTREETAKYFKTDPNPPGERLREWLGLERNDGIKPVKHDPASPWRRVERRQP